MADTLLPADFRDLTSPLEVDAPDGQSIDLAVSSVKPLPPHRLRAEPFSLILSGPAAPLLAQAIYRVRHPARGVIELFLVPIGQDKDSTRYEVTFN